MLVVFINGNAILASTLSCLWLFFSPLLLRLPICHFYFNVSHTVNQRSDCWLMKSLWVMRTICLLVTDINLSLTTPSFFWTHRSKKDIYRYLFNVIFKIYWKRLGDVDGSRTLFWEILHLKRLRRRTYVAVFLFEERTIVIVSKNLST